MIESRDELPNPEILKIKLIEEKVERGKTDFANDKISKNAFIMKKKTTNKMKKQIEKENYKQMKFNGNYHNYICKKHGHRAIYCRYRTENTK